MRHVWGAIGAVLVTALVVHLLYDLIKPYAGFLVAGAVLTAAIATLLQFRRNRYW